MQAAVRERKFVQSPSGRDLLRAGSALGGICSGRDLLRADAGAMIAALEPSITDLVAGSVSAHLTELRGVSQSERRHPVIADILTLLGHQSPFLKKLTFVIQQQPDGTIATGLLTVNSTTRSTDGYTAVEF